MIFPQKTSARSGRRRVPALAAAVVAMAALGTCSIALPSDAAPPATTGGAAASAGAESGAAAPGGSADAGRAGGSGGAGTLSPAANDESALTGTDGESGARDGTDGANESAASATTSRPTPGQRVGAIYSGRAGRTDFSAHRGGADGARPQSAADFRDAVAHGVKDLEFDVRYTRDGAAVVSHDPKIKCAPGGIQKTKAAALKKCGVAPLGTLIALAHKHQEITLRPELKSYPGQKSASKRAQATALARTLKKAGLLKRTVIQSFSYRTVTAPIKKVDKRFTVQALVFGPSLASIRQAKAAGANQYAYDANVGGSVLISRFAKRHGITPVAWWQQDNRPQDYPALYASGTKTLITDYAQRARQAVEQTACAPTWKAAGKGAAGKSGRAYAGTLAKKGWGSAATLGKGVDSLKYLAGVRVRVSVPGKHRGGSLVLVPSGGDAGADATRVPLTGKGAYTVQTIAGDGGRIGIQNTKGKPVKASVRVVGQQVMTCKAG